MSFKLIPNKPFNPLLLTDVFSDEGDLKIAHPFAKAPYCPLEWQSFFPHNSENVSLLFYTKEKIAGHAALVMKSEDVYLCYVILKKEFQGQGLSKEMVRLTEDYCRANHTHQEIFLNVARDNHRAIKLYESLGYEVIHQFEDKFKMKKALIPLIQ